MTFSVVVPLALVVRGSIVSRRSSPSSVKSILLNFQSPKVSLAVTFFPIPGSVPPKLAPPKQCSLIINTLPEFGPLVRANLTMTT